MGDCFSEPIENKNIYIKNILQTLDILLQITTDVIKKST